MTAAMWTGELALATAAIFAGAAVYVSVAEQPARLKLDTQGAVDRMAAELRARRDHAGKPRDRVRRAWGHSFLFTYDWRWLFGAALILAPWPYTMFIIMPTNKVLKSTPPEQATDQTRGLVVQWGRLHWGRSALGLLAVAAYLWALN